MRIHASTATSGFDVSGSSVTSASSRGAPVAPRSILLIPPPHVADRLSRRGPMSRRPRATAETADRQETARAHASSASPAVARSAAVPRRIGWLMRQPAERPSSHSWSRARPASACDAACHARSNSVGVAVVRNCTHVHSIRSEKRPQSDSSRAAVTSSRNAAAAALRASMRAGSAFTHTGESCTKRSRNGPRSGIAAAFATASS